MPRAMKCPAFVLNSSPEIIGKSGGSSASPLSVIATLWSVMAINERFAFSAACITSATLPLPSEAFVWTCSTPTRSPAVSHFDESGSLTSAPSTRTATTINDKETAVSAKSLRVPERGTKPEMGPPYSACSMPIFDIHLSRRLTSRFPTRDQKNPKYKIERDDRKCQAAFANGAEMVHGHKACISNVLAAISP